jgi:hypothetical protein
VQGRKKATHSKNSLALVTAPPSEYAILVEPGTVENDPNRICGKKLWFWNVILKSFLLLEHGRTAAV